ncbi:MAG: fibronectin type III domain-containing protein [Bacillota bacterium]|nr:fibronectin type III domain-containing protein [Bacillota bacterium]
MKDPFMKNLFKKLCTVSFALILFASFMPVPGNTAFAAEEESGTLGDGVTYTLVDGVLTISGNGGMSSYHPDNTSIEPQESPFYNKNVKTVIINEGVTNVGNNLLNGSAVSSVTFPKSLEGIGAGAFYKTKLTSIDLSKTRINHIGNSAFYQCSYLSCNLVLPDTLTSMGAMAFARCGSGNGSGLRSIVIPGSLKVLPEKAFMYNDGLQELTIQDGVQDLGHFVFAECTDLTSISLPESITDLGTFTFSDAKITSIDLPSGITYLDSHVLSGTKIQSIEIPASVETIGEYAFYESSLKNIVIPDTVTYVDDSAFSNCADLESIVFPENCILKKNSLLMGCKSLTSVTLPAHLDGIGSNMFSGCNALESLTIPETVTWIDKYAFSYCGSLKEITIPPNVEMIGEGAFDHCDSLTDITIHASACDIAEGSIPEGVTIHCYDGSTAEAYAKAHGLEIKSEGQDPNVWNISEASITGLSDMSYTGKAITQAPVIELNSKTLSEDVDYTLSYADNVKIGVATLTVTGQGHYTGTATATFKIVPKKTALKKLTAKKRALTVKWKRQSAKMPKARITGYRIQLATDENFTENVKTITVKGYKKTSKKIKRLNAKQKYYVRIQTYMKIGTASYDSAWSAAKVRKTK